jgi:tetratricopeptide (TPR) repeat protein
LAKSGINFKTQGSYTVKAHYGESKREIGFGFNDLTKSQENLDQISIPEKKPETRLVSKTIIPPSQNSNPQINETKKQDEPKTYEKDPEIQNNLTVKDIELGKMLNQMALNCDNSEYVDSISYYDGMGPALMRLCKYDSAITFFDRSLEENPENIGVLTNKGSALVRLGQYSEAITYYNLALKIQPDYLPAINNKANALADLGDFEGAISLYNSVLEHEPTYVVAQNNLEKAQEKLLLFTKNQKPESADEDSMIKVADKIPETENKVNHKEEKPANILEQIGNVFSFLSANVFGFMK